MHSSARIAVVMMTCPACEGLKREPCSECDGTGSRYPERRRGKVCWKCKGKGEVACPECEGAGEVEDEE